MDWDLEASDATAKSGDKASKVVFALVLLVAAGVVVASLLYAQAAPAGGGAPQKIAWIEQPETAFAQARQLNKPLLVRFVAQWCGVCKKLERETLSNPQVAVAVHESFVPLSVDVTDPRGPGGRFANQYMIQYLPTLLILDSGGRETARASGMMTQPQFLQWLAQ